MMFYFSNVPLKISDTNNYFKTQCVENIQSFPFVLNLFRYFYYENFMDGKPNFVYSIKIWSNNMKLNFKSGAW